jgi:hypothetical protein
VSAPSPITLVTTVGGVSSNSYLSIDEAEALAEEMFGADTWSAASDYLKSKSLLNATRQIDACRLHSRPAFGGQKLAFPRVDQDDHTVIPDEVKMACLLQAFALLAPDTGPDRASLQAQGVVSFTVGNHSETFGGRAAHNGGLSYTALREIEGWISKSGRILGARDVAKTPLRSWGPW